MAMQVQKTIALSLRQFNTVLFCQLTGCALNEEWAGFSTKVLFFLGCIFTEFKRKKKKKKKKKEHRPDLLCVFLVQVDRHFSTTIYWSVGSRQ